MARIPFQVQSNALAERRRSDVVLDNTPLPRVEYNDAIAQGIRDIGSAAFQIGSEELSRSNKIVAMDVANQWQKKAREAEDELRKNTLNNAVVAEMAYQKKLEDLRTEFGGKLNNREQEDFFRASVEPVHLQYSLSGASYAATENYKHGIATTEAGKMLAREDVIKNSHVGMDDALKMTMEGARLKALASMQIRKVDPNSDIGKVEMHDYMSTLHSSVVRTRVDEDPVKAREYMVAHRDEMTAETQKDLDALIKSKEETLKVSSSVEKALKTSYTVKPGSAPVYDVLKANEVLEKENLRPDQLQAARAHLHAQANILQGAINDKSRDVMNKVANSLIPPTEIEKSMMTEQDLRAAYNAINKSEKENKKLYNKTISDDNYLVSLAAINSGLLDFNVTVENPDGTTYKQTVYLNYDSEKSIQALQTYLRSAIVDDNQVKDLVNTFARVRDVGFRTAQTQGFSVAASVRGKDVSKLSNDDRIMVTEVIRNDPTLIANPSRLEDKIRIALKKNELSAAPKEIQDKYARKAARTELPSGTVRSNKDLAQAWYEAENSPEFSVRAYQRDMARKADAAGKPIDLTKAFVIDPKKYEDWKSKKVIERAMLAPEDTWRNWRTGKSLQEEREEQLAKGQRLLDAWNSGVVEP